jgi:hypothetical protein
MDRHLMFIICGEAFFVELIEVVHVVHTKDIKQREPLSLSLLFSTHFKCKKKHQAIPFQS